MTLLRPRLLPVTIVMMAVLLVVKSAGLVFDASAAQAPAGPDGAAVPAPVAATALSPPPPARVVAPVPKPPDAAAIPARSETAVLAGLRQRRDALDAREAALRARESLLAATELKLDQRVAELKALQTRLEQMAAARQQSNDTDWLGLVSLYEKMKPRDAARIFDDLEMKVLVRLLDRMNERRAAAIMAAMNPDKARETTTELARLRERRAADIAQK